MIDLSVDEARQVLLGTVGPRIHKGGPTELLATLQHIQLDPIDRIGTNADLVAMARLDGVGKGEIHQAQGFEHYAKERCLLPPEAFPYYRDQALETPSWRNTGPMKRVDEGLLRAVRDEVEGRGPLTSQELSDHGRVVPANWSGWKSSGKVGTLALEVLWTRCVVVVAGRRGGQRVYDLPARALPGVAEASASEGFATWGVKARATAAGLLSTASGPWWSMLKTARRDGTVDGLVQSGALQRVTIEGGRRIYLVRAGALHSTYSDDDRMRVVGPLDPLIWNRDLVQRVFDFPYVWEVYKPASKRRWGYYVCPLLHRGRLVGRLEARVKDGMLVVERVWREAVSFDEAALAACLARHARALGCAGVA